MRAPILALMASALACGGKPPRAPVAPVEAAVQKLPVEITVQARVNAWNRLSTATSGQAVEAEAAEEVPRLILQIFDQGIPEGPVDVVFVVDTTGSMVDDIDAVKADMRQILDHLRQRNPDSRIGVVAYRDVHDAYLTRTFLMLDDDDLRIATAIDAIEVKGGDDWPEHVYAGINTALRNQPWRPAASQHIILMGDAPPHDDYPNDPRNYEAITRMAQTPPLRVRIHTIGIKCDQTCEEALARENQARLRESRLKL